MTWQKIVAHIDPEGDQRNGRVNLANCVALFVNGNEDGSQYWVTARMADGTEYAVVGRFDASADAYLALDAIVLPTMQPWTSHPSPYNADLGE